jgi:hypothetical protein
MSVYQESGIEFDFSHALSHTKHDSTNSIWDGVDFLLEESRRWIWLEVKNWEPSNLPPRRRGAVRRSFLAKMQAKNGFFQKLRTKFLGTIAFLALTGNVPNKAILYVILLKTPKLDSALKLHALNHMRFLIPPRRSRHALWTIAIDMIVVDLADWNRQFPDYPARTLYAGAWSDGNRSVNGQRHGRRTDCCLLPFRDGALPAFRRIGVL